jgi:hypothetical protein
VRTTGCRGGGVKSAHTISARHKRHMHIRSR